jgi:RNA polymerase-binding transcription factor DksA
MATSKKTIKAKKAAKPAKKAVSNKKPVKPLKKVTAKPAASKKATKTVISKTQSKPAAKKTVAKKAVKAAPVPKKEVKKPSGMKSVSPKPAVKVVKQAVVKSAILPPAKPTSQPLKASIPSNVSKVNTPKTMIATQKNNGNEKSRYSDTELKEFKSLIIIKLDDARKELINLNAAIISANENGTDDTGASFKMLEDGSDTLAKEEAAQLAARQKKFIEQLEAALVRIENKTYGVCRVTGKLIPKERLRAVPHTTQSMEAKLQQYKD